MRDLIADLSQPQQKRMVLEHIRALEGPHRIDVRKHRQRRTDRQNKYYWPCFVQPFGDYLRAHGNSHFTDEMAHAVLAKMFLEVTVVDERTGQRLTYVRSTTTLDTAEFNEYLDKVAAFLATDCGFTVADPMEYREQVGV